jgi:hypothetical protein
MNAPEVVARDEDLQQPIKKMKTRELKRAAKEAAQCHQPPLK